MQFQLLHGVGYYRRVPTPDRWGATKETHMKNNKLIIAAIPSVLAVAALVLSLRSPVNADLVIGYASVVALVAVATLEYRINWKRVFGRE